MSSHFPDGHLPDGHFPDGHFPEVAPSSDYPSVQSSRRISLPAGGIWVVDPDSGQYCEVDWSGVLDEGVTLVSVSYSLPGGAGLTNAAEAIDTSAGKSAIQIDGANHGSMHSIGIVATLSNDDTISFTAPLRCFNG
jgi:hypothetical protein